MKKIKASLQWMAYREYGTNYENRYVCLVDNSVIGGEFTFCGCAIPDSRIDLDGFEAIGAEFQGSIKDVTCPNCLSRLDYIKSLK